MARVVLAMSGGVDSSVAALLLQDGGHEVVGVFMRHGEPAPVACAAKPELTASTLLPIVPSLAHKQGCCSASDAEDARRVADRLSIPFYALNFQAEFGRIIDYFVDEYSQARTPNPCVMCNNWIKFGRLFDYAESIGASHVATGHYARVVPADDGGFALTRGVDDHKDQSYVLFGLSRELLARMLLPVGEYRKEQIRDLARRVGLRTADKRDSQEICFVTSGEHAEFVRGRQTADQSTAGELVLTTGEVVGQHPGLEGFTIGQRKGLGVTFGEPRYVVRLEHATRRVVLGTREELARGELTADRANWLVTPPAGALRCQVKIRYNSARVPATVELVDDDPARLRVVFDAPQLGVAPGQAVVCYDGDRVLGGGWIE